MGFFNLYFNGGFYEQLDKKVLAYRSQFLDFAKAEVEEASRTNGFVRELYDTVKDRPHALSAAILGRHETISPNGIGETIDLLAAMDSTEEGGGGKSGRRWKRKDRKATSRDSRRDAEDGLGGVDEGIQENLQATYEVPPD